MKYNGQEMNQTQGRFSSTHPRSCDLMTSTSNTVYYD